MKNLYLLEKINDDKIISSLKNIDGEIIVFDYITHKNLLKNKIPHVTIDNYFTDNERNQIFKFCISCCSWYKKIKFTDIMFNGINLFSIIDRNEILEFLMELIPKVHIIKKIVLEKKYNKIFATSFLFEILKKKII